MTMAGFAVSLSHDDNDDTISLRLSIKGNRIKLYELIEQAILDIGLKQVGELLAYLRQHDFVFKKIGQDQPTIADNSTYTRTSAPIKSAAPTMAPAMNFIRSEVSILFH